MPKEAVTFDMDSDKRAALDEMAEALNRYRAELINEAVESYVAYQHRQIEHIKEGLAQADRGEFASDEEVERVFAKYQLPPSEGLLVAGCSSPSRRDF